MIIGIDARMYGAKQTTGIGQYIEKLTENLFKIDSKNQYVLFLLEPVFSKFNPPTEQVTKIKVTPHWYSYGEQLVLPWQLARAKLDLIHYPHFNAPILFAKQSVCTIHDLTPFSFSGHKQKSAYRRLAYQAVFRSTISKAAKIIAVSDYTKQEIIKRFRVNPEKITVTYEGVDERFKIINDYGIINKIKSRYGIAKPFIFFIGAWRNHKNIEGLIKSFEILKEKYSIPHQLVLAGKEDPYYPWIRQTINNLPEKIKKEIITPGFITDQDLPILYNIAEVLAIPSFIEGFGLIGIEAQACGCPVASSKTSALPEILADSAKYFNPNDHQEIAKIIFSVLNDQQLRENLKQQGLKNIARFSWEECANATVKIYEEAVNS